MVMKVVRGFTNYGDGTKVHCYQVLWLSQSTNVSVCAAEEANEMKTNCFYHIIALLMYLKSYKEDPKLGS